MRIPFCYISVLLIVLISCKEKEVVPRPENLISEDKMEDILFDVYFLNATKGYSAGTLSSWKIKPEDFIYEKYQIDSLSFAQSNIYYASNPQKYAALFNKVELRFIALKDSIDKKMRTSNEKRKETKNKTERSQKMREKIKDSTEE
ncbi:DUF4296 domain-containing protein [Sungkyunkwania multivorans]|uniref:DUF4296 domain-containing protein n=1 Tax=Sungkyunkwania multivorans TaxID=1173618 RepID=A0ABW3CTI6_9FLAO